MKFETVTAEPLGVTRDGDLLAMDFPAWPPETEAADPRILEALGPPPMQSLLARGRTLAVYDRAEDVASLRPDFAALRRIPGAIAVATAPDAMGSTSSPLFRAKPWHR